MITRRFLLVLFLFSAQPKKYSLLVAQDTFAAKTPLHFQRNPRFNPSRQFVHWKSRSVYNKIVSQVVCTIEGVIKDPSITFFVTIRDNQIIYHQTVL